MLGHTTVEFVLLTIGYFALPLRFAPDEPAFLAQSLVSLAAIAAVVVALRHWLAHSGRKIPVRLVRIEILLGALYLLVLLFALIYAVVSIHVPNQFDGIADKISALYFSVTVISTVGFGDIHATGKVGQVLVTIQMLVNLVYLGTSLRVLTARNVIDPVDPA